MLKHSLEDNHEKVSFEHLPILPNSYANSKIKRKILESLFIKELLSSLNAQETSVP